GVSADMVAMRHLRLAVPCAIGLGRGAPHIKTNHIPVSECFSCPCRGNKAPYWPGFQHRNRQMPGNRRMHHATVGLHDPHSAGEAVLLEHSLQPLDISAYSRSDVGIQHCSRDALVLAVLSKNFMRDTAIDFRV